MLAVILILCVIGIILWQFDARIKMDGTIKGIIYVVVIIAVLLWLLRVAGVWSGGPVLRP